MADLDEATPAPLSFDVRREGEGAHVVSLAGELDSSNVDTLAAPIAALLAERPERLIFDLGELRFMDSAGIAVLVHAAAEVGPVEVRDPSPIVRRVIEVTGLTNVLRIVT